MCQKDNVIRFHDFGLNSHVTFDTRIQEFRQLLCRY